MTELDEFVEHMESHVIYLDYIHDGAGQNSWPNSNCNWMDLTGSQTTSSDTLLHFIPKDELPEDAIFATMNESDIEVWQSQSHRKQCEALGLNPQYLKTSRIKDREGSNLECDGPETQEYKAQTEAPQTATRIDLIRAYRDITESGLEEACDHIDKHFPYVK
jgi:hypothetical protein